MFLIAGDEHSCDEIECCAPAGRRRRRVPAGTLARTRSHTCNRPRLSRSLRRRQGHTWTLSSGRVACDGTPTMCVFLLYTASAEGFIIIYLLRWVTSGQFSHKVSSRRPRSPSRVCQIFPRPRPSPADGRLFRSVEMCTL